MREESGKETLWSQTLKNWRWTHQNSRRLNAKEVLTPQRSGNFIFPVADGTVENPGRDRRLKPSTSIRDRPEQGEEPEILRGESDGLSSPILLQDESTLDDAEAKNDFWTITGDSIYRHHVEPRVKLYMPKEESFPIPLRYIDVTRATGTTLDVMLEHRIDDYWNIERNRNLSDSWTGFTRFIILDEKHPVGYTWSWGRLTKKQTTSRPDHLWPEIWKDMSDAAQRKEKQKWAIEKPKLDNARRLRGIYFTDPAHAEFKETIQNARRKLEVPMPAAMPCRIRRRK